MTFGRLHIVPHLGPFLEQNPQLNIDLMLDDRNINLVEEGVDVALRLGALSDSGLTARKIAECRRVVLGTPAYFACHGEPSCPADLDKHQGIVYNSAAAPPGPSLRAANRRSPSPAACGSAPPRVCAAVLADQGLTIASQWMFAPELASGAVRAVMSDWRLPDQDLWAVLPTGRMVSTKARAFVEYMENLLKHLT